MATAKSQAQQRRDIHPVDQFGRRWFASIEIATGDITGRLHIAGALIDPLRTPQKFVDMPRDDNGYGDLTRVEVNGDAWIAEVENDERDWYRQLHVVARDVYKRLDPTDIPTLENDAFVRSLTGPKPWPSSSVIRQAMAGDRQYLGLEPLDREHREALGIVTLEDTRHIGAAPATVPMPTAATAETPLPPDTYPEFLRWAFQHGGCKGDMAKAAKLWNEHRDSLKASTA